MEIIDQIIAHLKKEQGVKFTDVFYDDNNTVNGYVTFEDSDQFNRTALLKRIMKNLKLHLDLKGYSKIGVLTVETEDERKKRLLPLSVTDWNSQLSFSQHKPLHRNDRYLVVLDYLISGDGFTSFYFIFNEKYKFRKGKTFKYDSKALRMMEFANEDEMVNELMDSLCKIAAADIIAHTAELFEHSEKKDGLLPVNNPFSYIFSHFKLTPCPKYIALTPREQKEIKAILPKLKGYAYSNKLLQLLSLNKRVKVKEVV